MLQNHDQVIIPQLYSFGQSLIENLNFENIGQSLGVSHLHPIVQADTKGLDDVEKNAYGDDKDPEADAEDIFIQYFYSIWWIGIFGIYFWVQMPVTILILLISPQAKPGYEGDDADEEKGFIQELLVWWIKKNNDLIRPYAWFLASFFGGFVTPDEESYDIYAMDNTMAALHFFLWYWVMPYLITFNFPMAIILSPVYITILTIEGAIWFIEEFFSGDDKENGKSEKSNSDYDKNLDKEKYKQDPNNKK